MIRGGKKNDRGRLLISSDGAARGNPGPAGIGGVARDESGKLIAEVSEYIGNATNNVAEYQALIRILESVENLGYSRIRILTDSELVANQVSGGFKVKNSHLKGLVERVKSLLGKYEDVEIVSVPREENAYCDKLANRAIADGLAGKIPRTGLTEDERLF